MRYFWMAWVIPVLAQSGITTSHVSVSGLAHSSLQLSWDSSAPINAIRIRYGFTNNYEFGLGGGVFVPGTYSFSQTGQTVSMSGLAPDSDYHFCPQSSDDGGITWSPCIDVAVHTPPAPQPHPAPPEAPAEVEVRYPQQTGSVLWASNDCGDLQLRMNQARYGDTILIPAGATCSGVYMVPSAPEALSFTSTGVDTASGVIMLPQHGFVEGQKVRLGTEGCLPGSAGPDVFCQYRGLQAGTDYFIRQSSGDSFRLTNATGEELRFQVASFQADMVHGVYTINTGSIPMNGAALEVSSSGQLPDGLSSRKTFYVVNLSGRSFQLALSPGAPPLPVLGSGSGTHFLVDPGWGKHFIMAWPPPDRWIVVRTATPDDEFCPEGVRCLGKNWASKMARIAQMTAPTGTVQDLRLHMGVLSHHWRFTGIEFTHTGEYPSANTTTDPIPYYGFFSTNRSSAHIIFDRCYIHGLGFPHRLYRAIYQLDGEHIAIINSDLEHLDYWHPSVSGGSFIPVIQNLRTVELSPGSYSMGSRKVVMETPVSITLTGGSGSGTALVYFDMNGDLKVSLPAGVAGNCSPSCSVEIAPDSTPRYPENEQHRIAAAQVAEMRIVNGTFEGVSYQGGNPRSVSNSEGAQSLIAGTGPGPVLIQNNRISGSGIPIHFDDSGGAIERADYVVRRNLFTVPVSHQMGGPASDGLRYFHRNLLEWKGGRRILIEGNIFENNFSDVVPLGAAVMVTPVIGGHITDILMRHNTFRYNAGAIALATVDASSPSLPLERVSIINNLFHNNDGYRYVVKEARPSAIGVTIFSSGATADFVIDHNTFYDNRGWHPSILHRTTNPLEGMKITNNFMWVNNDSYANGISGENFPQCPGSAKALMECIFLRGANQPDYEFHHNLLMPGWASSATPTQLMDPALLRSSYAGLSDNWVLEGNTLGERLNTSAAPAGSDGHAIGVDMEALEAGQGQIGPLSTTSQDSQILIEVTVPDPGVACYALYRKGWDWSDDWSTFQRTAADRSASRRRTFRIEDLQHGGVFTVAVLCDGASNASVSGIRANGIGPRWR